MVDYAGYAYSPEHQDIGWVNIAPLDPARARPEEKAASTVLPSARAKGFDLFGAATGPNAPTAVAKKMSTGRLQQSSSVGEFSSVGGIQAFVVSDQSIDRVARDRVRLMAAKYASSAASVEIMARLEILNQRLLSMSPRVSEAQVAALEGKADDLARLRASRQERAKRLGLSA